MTESRLDMSPGQLCHRDGKEESGHLPGSRPRRHDFELGLPRRDRSTPGSTARLGLRFFLLVLGACALILNLPAASPLGTNAAPESTAPTGVPTNAGPHFDAQYYVLKYNDAVFTNAPAPSLSAYTGTNVDLERIVQAASATLRDFEKAGYPSANISIAQEQISNGVVTLNVYQGVFPQVLVSGRIFRPVGEAEVALGTNLAPATNAEPHFAIVGYEVVGNDLLSDETLESIFSKYVGTNLTREDVFNAQKDLVLEYRARGYATVNVVRPPQHITNGILRLDVTEGTLALINVVGNRWYSSNNVMRALPSLRTNMILNDKVLAAEFDRANANQDRQIYAMLTNGPTTGTTELDLVVKDRLPLHAKAELNNQASPGTPDLRVNTSAVYNNLWQENHSLGVSYNFSPELYKSDPQWGFYDRPLVVNYSGFYRLPLGNPSAVADVVEASPGTFGYDEATRKFNLPPPSGTPELNVFASRSTIDTRANVVLDQTLFDTNGQTLVRQDYQQDLTVNNDFGFRWSTPLRSRDDRFQSSLSGGLDFKTYELTSFKTNVFTLTDVVVDKSSTPYTTNIDTSTDISPVPNTDTPLQYLPLSLRYDASLRDPLGSTAFGLGLSVNAWHSGSTSNFQDISGSAESRGHWAVLTPSLSRDFYLHNNWTLSIHADGQWASEPLISNEQFGAGGVASVRGYQEGQVFGDSGWHLSVEQKTPGHIVGFINGDEALTVRGSLYMDYAQTYLLDPQGRPGHTPLWGTGFGAAASLGSHWEARFLFSVPLLPAGTIEAYQPLFNFSLTGQF
jgi:hemolysin activation/secretion protein